MPLLEVQEVSLRFGGLTAVKDITFSLFRGEIVSVIGPNGAGKTSLFNAITGVYEPTDGNILINQAPSMRQFTTAVLARLLVISFLSALGFLLAYHCQELWTAAITERYSYQKSFNWAALLPTVLVYFGNQEASSVVWPLIVGATAGAAGFAQLWLRSRRAPEVVTRFGISRTFQNIRLFPSMSVVENVLLSMDWKLSSSFMACMFALPSVRKEENEALVRANELLAFVGLDDNPNVPATALSYGHQRRLEIARALAANPSIILLDEPAAGMNPSETEELMELIRRIRDRGIAVVLIEHHMKVVMGISDRVVVLHYGQKIAEGTPKEIQEDPLVIEAYLGKDEDDAYVCD